MSNAGMVPPKPGGRFSVSMYCLGGQPMDFKMYVGSSERQPSNSLSIRKLLKMRLTSGSAAIAG